MSIIANNARRPALASGCAHNWKAPARLLDLIESYDARARKRLAVAYCAAFMAVLKRRATPAKGARVLRHVAALLRRHLDASDRDELLDAIARYRRGEGLPLLVPLTLLRYHLRRAGLADVMAQSYVILDPREEALRFHA